MKTRQYYKLFKTFVPKDIEMQSWYLSQKVFLENIYEMRKFNRQILLVLFGVDFSFNIWFGRKNYVGR